MFTGMARLGVAMGIDLLEVDVDGETYDGVLNVPEGEVTGDGVLVVPGAGHGPFGDIFDVMAYELAGAGQHVLRVETWETRDELNEKTLAEMHEEVEVAIDRLQSEGCSNISLLAKSFGGGIALTHVPEAVDRMVLWEPAVDYDVDESAAQDPTQPIGEAEEFLIGVDGVDDIDVPVGILCGDAEQGVPVEDCQAIVDDLADGELTVIPGENHGFNTNRTEIVAATLGYLDPDA